MEIDKLNMHSTDLANEYFEKLAALFPNCVTEAIIEKDINAKQSRSIDFNQCNLDLFADNGKPDRTADDLLELVILDWGLPLSLKIESTIVAKKQVFKVIENSLYACFDRGIDEDFTKAIAKDEPLRIVFKDSGFKNDTAKTNVKQLLKQLSPETEMKVI